MAVILKPENVTARSTSLTGCVTVQAGPNPIPGLHTKGELSWIPTI